MSKTTPPTDANTQPEGGAQQTTTQGSEPQGGEHGQQTAGADQGQEDGVPTGERDVGETEQPSGSSQEEAGTESKSETDGGDDASEEGGEEPQGAPESYDLQPPEGVEAIDEFREGFESTARELNLTQEQAQAAYTRLFQSMNKAQSRQAREWAESLRNDSDIGGSKFHQTMAGVEKFVERYAPDDLKTVLRGPSGLGSHPGLVRMIHAAMQDLSEDTFVGPGKGPKEVDLNSRDHITSALYGKKARA